MNQPLSNKYGGVCAAGDCHVYVEPGAGVRVRLGDKWRVHCPAHAGGIGRVTGAPETTPRQPTALFPRGETNRFAGTCMECSVPVAAGAAALVSCEDGKRRARCPICQEVAFRHERWNENDQFGKEPWNSDTVPAGCSPTIRLRILALNRACWKCQAATTCVVAVHPYRPAPTDVWPRTVNETSRMWVKNLLASAGLTCLAESIKPRWSATLGGRYLSSGCMSCDAL
jgi:hypothetical protein